MNIQPAKASDPETRMRAGWDQQDQREAAKLGNLLKGIIGDAK